MNTQTYGRRISVQLLLSLLLLLLLSFPALAQKVEIRGVQIRQLEQDAHLESVGQRISKTMVIDSVSCNCDGFWIMRGPRGDKPVKAFWNEKQLPKAKGFELKPDTYFIYPNLFDDSDSASVIIWLRRK